MRGKFFFISSGSGEYLIYRSTVVLCQSVQQLYAQASVLASLYPANDDFAGVERMGYIVLFFVSLPAYAQQVSAYALKQIT
jgi:hypothetical protein